MAGNMSMFMTLLAVTDEISERIFPRFTVGMVAFVMNVKERIFPHSRQSGFWHFQSSRSNTFSRIRCHRASRNFRL